MDKIKIQNNVFLPMPVTLVGCMLNGRPNFMTAGWVSRVNANPPWIGIGINRSHATPEGIIGNRTFSVCFPDRSQLIKTDYCGIASGRNADKSSLFTVFYGGLETAPMIEETQLSLECSLVQTIEGPTNFFFIGEIKGAYASPECLEDGHPSLNKAGCLILTMPDNTYWDLGESAGKAWSMGRELQTK